MRYLILATLVLLTAAGPAQAQRFFQRYDADELFPEEDGWARFWDDPEGRLVRTLENGIFRLDTRGSTGIFDLYELVSGAFILNPGEELRVTWRMQTFESSAPAGRSDVMLGIVNQSHGFTQFFLAPDLVSEDEIRGGTPEHIYPIDPQTAHTYDFVTRDMQEYDLFVDGTLAFHGRFHDYAWRETPRIGFGDTFIGYTSLSAWDYVQVAVVPEPSSAALVAGGSVLVLSSLRRL